MGLEELHRIGPREVDDMVEEHHRLADLIAAADRAAGVPWLRFVDLASAIRDHLDHEERTVLALLEQHLSRAECTDSW